MQRKLFNELLNQFTHSGAFFLKKIVLGVLASTKGTDLQAVIDAIEAKELDAEIACVVSNKKGAFALERAKSNGIEAIFLDPAGFASKEAYDEKLAMLLNERKVGLVLLIGYNKFLSLPFIDAFRNRVMNIHPSLLPAFKGWYSSVYRNVLEADVKETGCTLFFVDDEPDAGPIILQKSVSVSEGETVDSLREKVQALEQQAILHGIRLFQEGKLGVDGKKVAVKE